MDTPYISFRFCIRNITNDMIKITHAGVLGGPARMYDSVNQDWLNSEARLCISPGKNYEFPKMFKNTL